MARISKRVREEAIEALLISGDPESGDDASWSHPVRAVDSLVFRALEAVWTATGYRLTVEHDALEAAALLRGDAKHEPWSPGDPVTLLKVTP
jgi:hypothetical protein